MTRVLILGAGGHAYVVADIVLAMQRTGQPVDVVGFLDDNPQYHGRRLFERPVLGPLELWHKVPHDALIIAIGDNRVRAQWHEALQRTGARFFVAKHPRAVVAPDVLLGPGTVIMAGAVVNPGTVVGPSVILNTSSSVDHHNHIGAYAHIAPGAHLAGSVRVGEGALIGAGAVVLPGRSIGPWAVVGAGAVVVRDVPAQTTVVGVPARPLPPKKGAS